MQHKQQKVIIRQNNNNKHGVTNFSKHGIKKV